MREKDSLRNNYLLWFLRLVAATLLILSIYYWSMLTGISDAEVRFDTISTSWKVAGATLAVLQPVASLGLWGGWNWGIVLWILIGIIETVMYLGYPEIFGASTWVPLFHLAAFTIYLLMFAFIIFKKKAAEKNS